MRTLAKTGVRICDTQKPEWSDKAGGYAIQGIARKFVKRIDGDYFNVVGLPVSMVFNMLKEFGI